MAPAGPPSEPPDRSGRGPDDWDWGEDEWTADRPAPPRPSGPAPTDGPRRSAGPTGRGDRDVRRSADRDDRPTGRRSATDRATASERAPAAGRPAEPRPSDPRRPSGSGPTPTVIRRRRRLAAGIAIVLLLVVALTIASLGGSGSDDTRAATVPLLGDQVKRASASAVDSVQRSSAVESFAKLGMPVYCGAGTKPWVALTYDDGPGALSPQWIALLSKERIPVTVFRVGRVVPGREQSVLIQRNLGWDSGTHTQNHPPLASLSESAQRQEIVAGNQASQRVLGRPPAFFRPPYQSHNGTTDRLVQSLDQVQVLWNVDTQDSLGPTTADKIAKNAIDGLKPGSIILMHEIKQPTLDAMPKIIAEMRRRNLTPVTVSRLLAGDPPSEAQLRDGYSGCLAREAAGAGEQ